MKVEISKETFDKTKTELLAVGLFEKEMSDDAKKLDKILKGALSSMMGKEQFTGEWKQAELVNTLGNMSAEKVLFVGLGKKNEFSLEKLRKAAGIAAKTCRDEGIKKFATTLQNAELKASAQEKVQAVVEASLLALYDFGRYKTDRSKEKKVDAMSILVDAKQSQDAERGVGRGIIYADATNFARDIVNTPSNIMTPQAFAEEAQKVAKEGGMKITIFGKKEMQKIGMGAIVMVSEGSDKEPQFIVMEYGSGRECIAAVGKGITFDTGGIDVKPWDSMESMKSDKAGAAAVLGMMKACARLKPKVRLIGAMALTENMIGERAMKPGDIVKAYNGKTIEIMNTDAEGRLVLADAISYVEKNYRPSVIVDLATLTGACIIALGFHASGLICTDDKLAKRITDAGEKTFERVWQFPFWEEYHDVAKSDNADVRNVGKEKYGPGVISGAVFIKQFAEKTPWAHLDIAGPAWLNSGREYIPAGGTGWGVRLMVQLIEDWQP
ncbi:MAG: leucyl aminopeptidase [Candidatus Aenigmarchaeota archaeon]|nr:leucyl aminopeptidase [Candidatus Aenigmarchaeota archaeon]